jgi:hypothetical protein
MVMGSFATVHKVSKEVRALFNFPLPPRHFWKRWFNGCTVTEALLYAWLFAIEVRLE